MQFYKILEGKFQFTKENNVKIILPLIFLHTMQLKEKWKYEEKM